MCDRFQSPRHVGSRTPTSEGRRGMRGGGARGKDEVFWVFFKIQKQCTHTYDEQETRVTVGLFNREPVGEQECFIKVASEGVGCCCLVQ